MILERTVYDVKCSKCWGSLAYGYANHNDAKRCEDEASIEIDGEPHALCAKCKRELNKKGEAAPTLQES